MKRVYARRAVERRTSREFAGGQARVFGTRTGEGGGGGAQPAKAERGQRWMRVFPPADVNCTLVHAGVRSRHGSQMREHRVRPGAYRGTRLRDGARAHAESSRRFHRFLHPVRARVARVPGRERIESGCGDRLDSRWRKRRSASRRSERIPRRSSVAVASASGARGLPSPVASAPAGQLLIRHRKGFALPT